MVCLEGKIQLNKSFSNSALSLYCEHCLSIMYGWKCCVDAVSQGIINISIAL